MATPVMMPRQGQSVESCIITKWHKKVGDPVAVGDLLFSYETDKSAFDEEATVAGTMLAVFFEEGDDVECLLNVCVIGNDGESTAEFAPKAEAEAEPVKEEAPKVETVAEVPVAVAKEMPEDGKIRISPRARHLAEKQNIDIRLANGTGPKGRIIERDIRNMNASATGAAYAGMTPDMAGTGIGGRVSVADLTAPATEAPVAAPATPVAAYEDVKLSNIRKVIAKSMHESLANAAQLTMNLSFDATDILAFRKRLKDNKDALGLENITLNDIVCYAVSKTLLNHKDLNAHFLGDTMRYFNSVNLGIAVDTPRGLMVPTVFGADKMTLNEFAKQSKAVIAAAQGGTISPDLLRDGTFTVTNLGSLGIESFTPVLNPPQTGILGVNTLETKVREVNGELKPYQAMTLSLTFDHRATDGAPAAKFLAELKKNLENFSLLLAK